jgi:hypothetical protein
MTKERPATAAQPPATTHASLGPAGSPEAACFDGRLGARSMVVDVLETNDCPFFHDDVTQAAVS